jgi:hypothetical protein
MTMKKLIPGLVLLAAIALAIGCSSDDPVRPEATKAHPDGLDQPQALLRGPATIRPGEYYAMFWNDIGYADFSRISRQTGEASLVWQLDAPMVFEEPFTYGWITFGFAFDVDGTMYSTFNIISVDPAEVRSQFGRIDRETGEVELYGPIYDFNTAGGAIDACGNFYVCGFEVPMLGYIWGNDNLYRVDKVTGEFTVVGPTGHTHWMDLAFDRDGVLWGTFDNELYTIDTETGASHKVTDIYGVPDAGPPHMMEIMSIAFDKHNVLYGTGLTTLYDHPEGSPVMRIDVDTGEGTLVGYSQTTYANHGGDIMPTTVRVAHLLPNGRYNCITINMNALPAHLARGGFVLGSAGYPCECP